MKLSRLLPTWQEAIQKYIEEYKSWVNTQLSNQSRVLYILSICTH